MTMPGAQGGDTRTANVVLDAQVQPYQQQMAAGAASTNQFADAVDKLDAKLSGLSKRAGQKLIHFSAADFAALGGATADAATLEKQLGTLNATAVVTNQAFGGIKGSVESAFTKFPVARTQVVALVEALSNLGVTGTRDLSSLTQTFIKLGAATGEPMADLASGLTQLSRLMGTTGSGQIANYANSLLTVSKNAGVSATGVLSFAQNIAPLARQAGIGQAAVLGISAAFSKAGADGYVAGNTFNSIVGDITNLIQSGSPELAKYANLIGKTQAQFKAMDKTTAITEIFDTISRQGPKAITTLNQLGIDGVRAQSAIAGVVQSGNLQQSIQQAIGASHDQNNLNAGSKAAFSNLADDLSKLRNNFTQVGDEIGATFLRPIEGAVSGVNRMFTAVNMLIKPLAPLIALLGGVAGGLGAIGGAALGAAGIIGAGALARNAFRSGPVRAIREGVQYGRTGEANASSARFEADGVGGPLRARASYVVGRTIGAKLGEPSGDGPSLRAQAGRAFLRAPFRATAAYMNSTSGFLAGAMRNDYDREAYQGGGGGVPDTRNLRTRIGDAARAAKEENLLNTSRMGATRAVISESTKLAGAFARLTGETAKAGLGMAGGRVGRGIASAGSAFTSALFSPMGMIGSTVGLEVLSQAQASLAKGRAQDTDSLNPITKYNDALGIATTNLATFAAAVNTAAQGTNNLNGVTASSSFANTARDTNSDVQAIQGQKSTDATLNALAKQKGGKQNVGALSALAQSYNLTDPRQMQLFKNNANAAGFTQDTVTAALQSVVRTQGGTGTSTNALAVPGFDAGTQAIARSENVRSGVGGLLNGSVVVNNESESGKKLFNALLSGIGTTANDNTKYGDAFANQKKFADQLSLFGSYANNFSGTVTGGKDQAENVRRKALANALATAYQGNQDDYLHALNRIDFTGMNATQRQQAIVSAIGATQQGRNQLGTVTTTNVSQFQSTLSKLFSSGQLDASRQAIANTGATGRFALNNSAVLYAQSNQGNANAQYAGAQALYQQAMRAGKGFDGATEALDKMKGAIQNVNDPLYMMADAAKQIAQREQSYVLPTMSRGAQSQAAVGQYRAAQANYNASAAANGGTASPDASAGLVNAESTFQQQKEADRQYLISIYQQAQSYGTQMERAQEDQDTTILRNHRDFNIQMQQSDEDRQRQVMRSTRDFNIQMQRQAEQAAQSIYDPYTRVSAKYTADAGTLVQNLEDQNQRIAQQMQQEAQIRKMGVSQQAIDALNLSDPNNAQQLNDLVDSLTQNPDLIKKINQAVGVRVQGATKLTQNNFSETFRNTVADFQRSLDDASKDYQISHDRAVQAQARALGDMSADYNKMIKRSGQDLQTAMTEIYGSYANVFGRTMSEVTQQIGKYAPQAASVIQQNLDAIKLPQFMQDLAAAAAAGQNMVGGQAAGNSTAERNRLYGGHASGGISTRHHLAEFSERDKAEAIIPLDQRGQQFMAGFAQQVAMAQQIRQQNVSRYPAMPTGTSPGAMHQAFDMSTQFTGPITVVASNIEQLTAQLKQQARLQKLRSPTASTAGSNLS